MKRKDWLEVVDVLNLPVGCCPHYSLLSKRFELSEEALGSIYAQENQRRIIQSNSRLQEHIQALARRYFETNDFLSLCCQYNWPPCFLIRRLLEVQPWNFGRQKITKILRAPELLLEAVLPDGHSEVEWNMRKAKGVQDIKIALLCDPTNSPEADIARRNMGLHFELQLSSRLHSLGLAFWTEEALRAKGFFKTPDAKLQVPFLYRGRVISWIDSKASFGGQYMHQQQAQEQYRKYVNRYGAGMVIYWFGVIDELADSDQSVVLVSDVPAASEIVRLPCLEMAIPEEQLLSL